jgi:zinc protease
MRSISLVLFLAACGPKSVEPTVSVEPAFDRTTQPGPLERSEFALPVAVTGQLSNGLNVILIEDDSMPMVEVSLAFQVGGWSDPEGQYTLASSTFDMLTEGAGELGAAELSTELRRLASRLSTSGGDDGGGIRLTTLSRNLAPSLDLMALTLLEPAFSEEEWEIKRRSALQNLAAVRSDANKVARRIAAHVRFGNEYNGRLSTEDQINAITVDDMRSWWSTNGVAANANLYVSGDTNLDELLPLLEERFGAWEAGEASVAPEYALSEISETEVYFVDVPGAAQSVFRFWSPMPSPATEGYEAVRIGNQAFGGMFTARLNMNLREDKGYTYGANSWVNWDHGQARWELGTSVRTDATVASLNEILSELSAVVADERPLTDTEIERGRSNIVQGFPGRFEQASYLLGQLSSIWKYGLPSDWVDSYIERAEAVTSDQARAAFSAHIASQPFSAIIVGDWAAVGEQLTAVGLPIHHMDADGNSVEREVPAPAPTENEETAPLESE